MVVLYGTNTQGTPQVVAIFDTAYTNGAGLASFNYNDIYQLGQAGVAVLDIKAQKLNKIGQGIIKIEPEQVNENCIYSTLSPYKFIFIKCCEKFQLTHRNRSFH